jgi:trimeric autotransporter adhesin
MNQLIQFKATTPLVTNSVSQSRLRRSFILLTLVFACFALLPRALAVLPAPDGGYPGQNTAEGTDALFSLTTGVNNTAVGFDSLFSNTDGSGNTATGSQALFTNTGFGNTATGFAALFSNTIGDGNTATGIAALHDNTTGRSNTATGGGALQRNTTGVFNTATGSSSLLFNIGGSSNTATGVNALNQNRTGASNTATGVDALIQNTIGDSNTATGVSALHDNRTGRMNTATGVAALVQNQNGINNTATGVNALFSNRDASGNTANGVEALRSNTTGTGNIALGFQAGANLSTGNNNIDIGNLGVAGESNTIRIGTRGTQISTYIAGIMGKTVGQGVPVIVDNTGNLGTANSSARFKEAIKPMAKASEIIHALKPVTFRYKQELDPEGIPQFGLVAEEVEKVNPDLVSRDEEGKAFTVRYEAVNAMLLNEFLKEHRKNEEQEKTIAELKSGMTALAATVKEQASQIQKVSAQLEASKPAPQMVENNQ